jgi:ABC-type multidrug transport system ATPase subunit
VDQPGETYTNIEPNATKCAVDDFSGLQVSSLSKRFGRFQALENVGFELRPGEVLGLIGPNGAGKTTLFECVAGLLPCDSGLVQAGGRPIREARARQGEASISEAERASLLFYLPDGIAPWSSQSVQWILDFSIGFFGGRREVRDEAVERLGLTRLLHQRLGTLSKGERKRVLLAIGLVTPQPVLLADEPFDGLDLRQTREVASMLRAHAAGGRTLFLSIHQISDAARACDRFVLLSSGRVRGEGTLEQVSALAAARTGVKSADLEEVFLALT